MTSPQVTHCNIDLRPDSARTLARFFVPGREDVGAGESRAAPVIERLLGLAEEVVEAMAATVIDQLARRHRRPDALLRRHASLVRSRIDDATALTPAREVLLGACFTHEYAIESAALCNPSIVPHPVQRGRDALDVIMSVRGIGEGHRSSIGFRTATVAADGTVTVDVPGPYPVMGTVSRGFHHRSVFHAKLAEVDDDRENASFVLDPLPECFTDEELDGRLARLDGDRATRNATSRTIEHVRHVAGCSYRVSFEPDSALDERVLWPHAPLERHGMEDARFVRFVDDDGTITHLATYTGFDGFGVAQQLLETHDFTTFDCAPLAGAAAANKGLALFPRRVHGRFAALSRSDRETNAIAYSDDLRCWPTSTTFQTPSATWELLQLGNCGAPIETGDGWLVLTHGVGPLRTYAIGAVLLDLDDPVRVIARASEPLITPTGDGRNGYVPNVVYSCGAVAHGDVLVIPYGVADQTIAVATLSITALIQSMDDA
jgi:predicted GH43/DUF377 family glycosyl hydrolase